MSLFVNIVCILESILPHKAYTVSVHSKELFHLVIDIKAFQKDSL